MPKQRGRRRRQRKEGAAPPSGKPAPEVRQGERREAKRAPGARQGREAKKRAAVSPLAFWRRARPRTYREPPVPKRTVGRLWRRVAGFYFPPWVPVAVVIGVVGFILLVVIVVREGGAVSPLRGDHWHASYEIYVCGTRQPQLPQFPGGVHTHGDGIVHVHPQQPFEEGTGARLVKWFEYAGDAFGTGGRLSADTLQIPGQTKEYRNGDACSDGQTGVVQVYVNGQRLGDVGRYIPHDGDVIRILFGPEGVLPPGVSVSPTPAASPGAIRTIKVEASDRGNAEVDSFFAPDTFSIQAGEKVKVEVKNEGSISHNLRIAGIDGQYLTGDDFVTEPLIITPGKTGTLEVQIDQPGTYPFHCDIHPQVQFGTLTVEPAP